MVRLVPLSLVAASPTLSACAPRPKMLICVPVSETVEPETA